MRVDEINGPKKTIINGEVPTIHAYYLLDRSSSMQGERYNTAAAGIEEDIKILRELQGVNYTLSVAEFGSYGEFKQTHLFTPLENVKVIRWLGAHGNTALYDAVGDVLTQIKNSKKDNEKAVLNIFTDGGENDSRRFRANDLQKLIKEAELLGVTVTFQGTQYDIDMVIRSVGIDRGNTFAHQNTGATISTAALQRKMSMVTYSKSVMDGADNEELTRGFYTKTVNK